MIKALKYFCLTDISWISIRSSGGWKLLLLVNFEIKTDEDSNEQDASGNDG